jgi:hypothetical protein
MTAQTVAASSLSPKQLESPDFVKAPHLCVQWGGISI